MYINATYTVRADGKSTFPYIGQTFVSKYEGVQVSGVVKEIQKIKWVNPDWMEKKEFPTCIVQLLVQIDEQEYYRNKRKQKALSENKLIVLDGGFSK